ncbi:MAG: Na/Pi cotransporter family protein [Planctomycetota bacterium]|jgi:phosphate:Na+ symporter
MDFALAMKIAFKVIGGLGIFMLGMKYMSDGLQTIAGNRLRNMIAMVTNNRLLATGIGVFVTCLVQSSSVTTVMVIGFVNSSFMTLSQAIGVIMGANIGTTITGWLLVLKIGKYGLPILGAAALIYRFTKNEKWRYIAMAVMGIGMVFFGLELMKNGFKPIRGLPDFEEWFHAFQADSYFGVIKCGLVGCILTMIVQSSSATLGITIGLATVGVINFETGAALVLGENIGTTITAFLASLGTTTNAKRAAYAHVIFNIIGFLWITAIFSIYITIIRKLLPMEPDAMVMKNGIETYPFVTAGIALVHTGFNITNTAMFLPFTPRLAAFLERIVPDKPFKEHPHITQLDLRVLETPVLGIEQSRVEIMRMSDSAARMMHKIKKITDDKSCDNDLVKKIFHREEVLDIIQKEIVVFLTELLSDNVSHDVADEGRRQLRMADEYESVGDYIANILKLRLRLENANLSFSDQENDDIKKLHVAVESYLDLVNKAYLERDYDIISKAHSRGDAITHLVREIRSDHLARVTEERADPLKTVLFIDTLNAYRKVKDHVLNMAEAMAGEK